MTNYICYNPLLEVETKLLTGGEIHYVPYEK